MADAEIAGIADVLRSGEQCLLLIGGAATREPALRAASRIGVGTGAKLLIETFPARLERGAGLPAIERVGYLAEHVEAQLAGVEHLILAGTRAPVSFFAYPGRPSDLVPDGCTVHVLARGSDDVVDALERLADLVAPDAEPVLQEPALPEMPSGELTAESMAETIGVMLPERAIVADESITSGTVAAVGDGRLAAPRHPHGDRRRDRPRVCRSRRAQQSRAPTVPCSAWSPTAARCTR